MKKLKKLILLLSAIMIMCSSAIAQNMTNGTATVAWDISCNTNVTQYVLYYGKQGTAVTNVYPSITDDCGVLMPTQTNVYNGSFTNLLVINGRTNFTCVISNLTRGVQYFAIVTCKTAAGRESSWSDQIAFTLPILPPTAVKNFKLLKVE